MPSVPLRRRWWQALALMIGVAELGVLLYVFVGVPETITEHRTVSTNLISVSYYRAAVTALVALQLLIVVAYMARFLWVDFLGASVAVALVVLSFMGWVMVVVFPGERDPAHVVGSAVFLSATAAYTVELLSMAMAFEPAVSLNYNVYCATVYACAAGFAVAYGVLYFSDPAGMWLWENLAFIFMVVGNLVFFWFHPFDPTEAAVYDGGRGMERGEEQAAPLMRAA